MATNKDKAKKVKLTKAKKEARPGPFWALLRKYGKRRSHRWRLNPRMRRHWRRNKIKV